MDHLEFIKELPEHLRVAIVRHAQSQHTKLHNELLEDKQHGEIYKKYCITKRFIEDYEYLSNNSNNDK